MEISQIEKLADMIIEDVLQTVKDEFMTDSEYETLLSLLEEKIDNAPEFAKL